MRKRMISAVLMLCMALSLCLGVQAETALPYKVGNIYFSDMMGNEMASPADSCMVNVTVTKTSYRAEKDSIIIAAYATDGTLQGLSFMRAAMPTGSDTEFAALMNFQGKTIGVVKAYVWDSLAGMRALSNVAELEVNKTEPISKPEQLIPDTFIIKGIVIETGKTGNSSLKSDETIFRVSDYDFGFDYRSCSSVEQYQELKAKEECIKDYYKLDYSPIILACNDIDLSNYLNMYISLEISVDKNNFKVERFIDAKMNNICSLDASLFDDEDTAITDVFDSYGNVIAKPFVKYYDAKDSARSAKYTLDRDFEIYVNGVKVDTRVDNFKKFVYENTVGSVELVDRYEPGKGTDGYYDMIKVEYFETARVDSVTSRRIMFQNSTFSRSSLTLDKEENEDLTYHIYYNDAEVAITALKKDDILSIAYDVEAGITNSNFYDIYVSRDTQEGTYTTKDDYEKTVRVNGEDYKFVASYTNASSMILGNAYKLYLDYFGRIYDVELVASTVKLAIIDRVVTSSSYDSGFGAVLYFPDGTTKTLEVDAAKTGITLSNLINKVYINGAIDSSDKVAIQNRVVKYQFNFTGEIIVRLEFQDIARSAVDYEYRERTNAVGAVKMNSATQIIDAREYNALITPSYFDLKIGSLSTTFKDGLSYTAYAYGYKNSDGTYPFVLVTMGSNESSGGEEQPGYPTNTTHFAVVSSAPRAEVYDISKEGYTLELLYNGEKKNFFVTNDANVDNKVVTDDFTYDTKKGDIIVFDLNQNEEITNIVTLFSSDSTLDIGSKYATTANKFITAGSDLIYNLPAKWLTGWSASTSDRAAVVGGVILAKQSGYFTLGQIKDGKTYLDLQAGEVKSDRLNNVGGVFDYIITDDTKVSVFDYAKSRASEQYYIGGAADIIPTVVADAYKNITTDYKYKFEGKWLEIEETYEGEAVDWNKEYDGIAAYELIEMNFAIAKVVDGFATDVFVIKGYIE